MKKIFLLALVLLISSEWAYADQWRLDLSSLGLVASVDDNTYSSSVIFDNTATFITNEISKSTIVQSLTGGADDTILDNGDTFSFSAVFQLAAINSLSVAFKDASSIPMQYYAYLEFNNISGYINNIDYGSDSATTLSNFSTNIVDDSYNLILSDFSTISFYLDTDFDSSNGAILLAYFDMWIGTSTKLYVDHSEGLLSTKLGLMLDPSDFWELWTSWNKFIEIDNIINISPGYFYLSGSNIAMNVQSVGSDGTDLVLNISSEGEFEFRHVPEPATVILLSSGFVGMICLGFGRRAKEKK